MKIVIDLTSLSYHMTGIERYAACIAEKMIELDNLNTYILLFRDKIFSSFENIVDDSRIKAIILHGDNKLLFYQLILPITLYKIKADRYLFLAFTSPILFRKKGIYNTIHDMGAWDVSFTMSKLQRIYWRAAIRFSMSVSQGIITVSEFSKQRIVEILKYSKEKIKVVPSAIYEGIKCDTEANIDSIRKKYNIPPKYIMTLSTLEPRKNMKILLEAYSDIQNEVDYDLVLVGRNGWLMEEILGKYNHENRIHITGFVKDEHIALIYKNALCFIFPSLYEGFGLPPLESLSLGTPVIASDAASIPEVLMDQAVYFKNDSKLELELLLRTIEENVCKMPHELNDYQKNNYNFSCSAKKILDYIS